MIFTSLLLDSHGVVRAEAKGHADEVVISFRKVCQILLGSSSPWRITKVHGNCPDDMSFDSSMEWILEAKTKSPATKGRLIL